MLWPDPQVRLWVTNLCNPETPNPVSGHKVTMADTGP